MLLPSFSEEDTEAIRGLVISPGFHREQESHCGSNLAAPRSRVNLHASILLTLQTVPHFTDEETEAQRSYTGLWSQQEEPFSLVDNFVFHS